MSSPESVIYVTNTSVKWHEESCGMVRDGAVCSQSLFSVARAMSWFEVIPPWVLAARLVLIAQTNSYFLMADNKAVGGLGPVLCHRKHCASAPDVGKYQRIGWAEGCPRFFQRLWGAAVVRSVVRCCQSRCARDHVCPIAAGGFLLLCLGKMLGLYIFFLSRSCSVVICCKGVKSSSLCFSIQGSSIELLNLTVKCTSISTLNSSFKDQISKARKPIRFTALCNWLRCIVLRNYKGWEKWKTF